MQTLSPSEHLQAPVQVRFPFRHEQLKVVQPLLQLSLHACAQVVAQVVALRVWQQGVNFLLSNQNRLMVVFKV